MMGKALSGELSCPCDRSCFIGFEAVLQIRKGKRDSLGIIINISSYKHKLRLLFRTSETVLIRGHDICFQREQLLIKYPQKSTLFGALRALNKRDYLVIIRDNFCAIS